jgi:hypothetical protein
MGTPWGTVQGEAIRRELTSDAGASEHAKAAGDQADLDTQELRELERAEYYADVPPPAPTAPPPHGIVARIKGLFIRS